MADLRAGVAEVRLEEGLPSVRLLTPPTAKIGLPLIRHVAISDKWIVVSHLGRLAWKAVDGGGWQVQREAGFFHEFDISGDELIVLGFPDITTYDRSRGGVLWQADLAKGLDHWEVLYESKEVAEDLDVIRSEFALGSVRFLPRGGFVVAPSFVPGVLRFSSSGALKEQWSAEELWGNEKAWQPGRVEPKDLRRFLAAGRTIEEVLPLPEGPAIVVREPKGDGARYRLGVLGSEIRWYEIPVRNVSGVAQLRGDADDHGRIVLMGVVRSGHALARVASSEILVLKLPQ